MVQFIGPPNGPIYRSSFFCLIYWSSLSSEHFTSKLAAKLKEITRMEHHMQKHILPNNNICKWPWSLYVQLLWNSSLIYNLPLMLFQATPLRWTFVASCRGDLAIHSWCPFGTSLRNCFHQRCPNNQRNAMHDDISSPENPTFLLSFNGPFFLGTFWQW